MPKRLSAASSRAVSRKNAATTSSIKSSAKSSPRKQLLATTRLLWLVAGISIGSFTTRLLDQANLLTSPQPQQPQQPQQPAIDIDIAIDTAHAKAVTTTTTTTTTTQLHSDTTRTLQKKQPLVSLPSPGRPQFHELQDQISKRIHLLEHNQQANNKFQFGNSAYNRATVVSKAQKWLPFNTPLGVSAGGHRKVCRDTCCVQTVAISLQQDAQQLIHCRDGFDLADAMIVHASTGMRRAPYLHFHASYLRPEIIPCLVPGTIIQLDNHVASIIWFWKHVRPHINVPYVLVTAGSDGDTPQIKPQFMQDPLLLKWYGNNPNVEPHRANPAFMEAFHKFHPMHLGLSGFNHPQQEQHILPYLQLVNFTNPFLNQNNKERWDLAAHPFQDFDQEVFVHFGMTSPRRKTLWENLCGNSNNKQGVSCNQNTANLNVRTIYSDMSRYRFGLSPPGQGWDCYRTYEMLLLGVIPIVDDRGPVNRQMFDGLPVVFINKLAERAETLTQQDIAAAIRFYISSDEFQKADFSKGWERLFLQYNRQQLLKDTGRDKEILTDEQGNMYYQAYQYTIRKGSEEQPPSEFFCFEENSCLSPEERQEIPAYIRQNQDDWYQKPVAPLEGDDQRFLDQWQELSKGRLDQPVPGQISRAAAEQACAHWNAQEKPMCVSDVMASGDLDMAKAGGY
ncbi:expressed unknown protein [Seminavis robusta]|uniref:Exostosin GT47 domain-containing protein n=1 Tax=Seminavis robusta TaxID=568900 RepID=A0A9N8DBZ0_9STRA|nr:expressed unknown protein [Seminavis robusta]|eukprot:Sro52_g031180.1 n/a (676) ;mRNA; r:122692-124719